MSIRNRVVKNFIEFLKRYNVKEQEEISFIKDIKDTEVWNIREDSQIFNFLDKRKIYQVGYNSLKQKYKNIYGKDIKNEN